MKVQNRFEDPSQELRLGTRVFCSNGDIRVHHPLYDIQLTDQSDKLENLRKYIQHTKAMAHQQELPLYKSNHLFLDPVNSPPALTKSLVFRQKATVPVFDDSQLMKSLSNPLYGKELAQSQVFVSKLNRKLGIEKDSMKFSKEKSEYFTEYTNADPLDCYKLRQECSLPIIQRRHYKTPDLTDSVAYYSITEGWDHQAHLPPAELYGPHR